MRVVLVGRFQDLHAVDADPRPHCVLRPAQTEFGHAVQQHVVELAGKETQSVVLTAEHVRVRISAVLV